jgi:two-component system sensor histidine kinase CpxA
MKLTPRSLFFKIFLWFWATVLITGIALVLTLLLKRGNVPSQWHAMLENTASSSGTVVVTEMEQGGSSAASAHLDRLDREAHLYACLFDLLGNPLAGTRCDTFQDMVSRVVTSKRADFSLRYGIVRVAMMQKAASGHEYIFATELPAGPRAAFGNYRRGLALDWGVAFLVSGVICYLLTRYLTEPILQLRQASQQLAAGELSTRAAAGMERRRDELGDLVQDFNAMANRIEDLISQQRQLIYDVSHEFRSPLARLNVALDLVRTRKGSDSAFVHMEQDLERLSEMIGRLLTIARLDTSTAPTQMTAIDLNELVSQIVQDANFESRDSNGGVHLIAEAEYLVRGNTELLHSAIENVIRNAVHYTEPATTVEVHIQPVEVGRCDFVRLTIRDHGPGVPDSDLLNIFRPFYRVASARDRLSGGTGLGLAIADRVIQLHGGTIRAENADPQGLQVEIQIPLLGVAAQECP